MCAASPDRVIATVGPGPGQPGGMSSVMEAYLRLPLQHFRFESVPSWAPESQLWGLRPALVAARRILMGTSASARWHAVHLHLSERGSFVREGALARLARLRGIPTVITLHGAGFTPFAQQHPRIVGEVLGSADVVVCLGPEMEREVRALVGHKTRVVVIPNPIALPGAQVETVVDDEVVLFAGEIGQRKGADVLLEAWPTVRIDRPNARLLMAGPEADVVRREIDGVEWLGPRSQSQVIELLDRCTVAVLPSNAEVMPMFLLEAMAHGRPVVATGVGEIPFLLGGLGILVDQHDPVALATAVVAILTDPQRGKKTGQELRERAETLFSFEVVAAALDELYTSL